MATKPLTGRLRNPCFQRRSSVLLGLAAISGCSLTHAGSLTLDQRFNHLVFHESWQSYALDSHSLKLRYADTLWQNWHWSAALSKGSGQNSQVDYNTLGGSVSVSWSGDVNWFSLSYGNHRNLLKVSDQNGTASAGIDQYASRSHFHSQSLTAEFGHDIWLGDAWLLSGWVNATQSKAYSDYSATSISTTTVSTSEDDDGENDGGSDNDDGRNSGRDDRNDSDDSDSSTDDSSTETTETTEQTTTTVQRSDNEQSGTDLGLGLSLAWLAEDSRGWLWSPGASLDYQKTVVGQLLTSSGDDFQPNEQEGSSTLATSWSSASLFLNVFDDHWSASLSYHQDLDDSDYYSWVLGAGINW